MGKKKTETPVPASTAITLAASKETEVAGFISQAIAQGLPVETMEKLFALHEKVKAEKAREAFVVAMANFQKTVPVIKKTKPVMNKDGRTVRYMFAPIDSIVQQIKEPLAANGLAYTWTVEQKDQIVRATCRVTHIFGHSEESSFEIPTAGAGDFMTAPQKVASALTFAKRYTLCNVLGISTADEDTDATDVGKEPMPKDPKAKIVFILRALGQEAGTVEQVQKAVSKHTDLKLIETNYARIAEVLEGVLKIQQEHDL
jgi:hypothetical protein